MSETYETYDWKTMDKVYDALREVGVTDQQAVDAVTIMQNAGILFRERATR